MVYEKTDNNNATAEKKEDDDDDSPTKKKDDVFSSSQTVQIIIPNPEATGLVVGKRLYIPTLNRKINIAECKPARVGDNKITISLKKSGTETKWYDLKSS